MSHDVEKGSDNIYADIGGRHAEQMQLKAQLAMAISEIILQKGLTQQQAARQLGMPQPKLSNLLRGQFRGISEAKMLECLVKLGYDVDIVVGEARAIPGMLRVSFG